MAGVTPASPGTILQVALDVPLATLFDYRSPAGETVSVGERVVVPFGRRERVGVVLGLANESALAPARLKPASRALRDAPALPLEWLELMRFLAGYYQRPLGETVIAALPPRLRSVKPLPRKALTPADPTPDALRGRLDSPHPLTASQAAAAARIAGGSGFAATLLHGVTGSGKTEVYLHAIAATVQAGHQALVLVPEIGLTPQLEARFRAAFPSARIVVLHSALEDVPRTAGWVAAARGAADIILGTRLAVLAPMPRLGLLVVDEEHDASFKQQDGLRYSGRDAAVMKAKLARCPIVLGTATPSLETWHNAQQGRYAVLSLPERAAPGAVLPAVRLIDVRTTRVEHGLAAELVTAIGARLARGEQSLVFINRRGYAPVLACEACGWLAGCARCSARLVLHTAGRAAPARLRCHHCGAEHPVPRGCPTCGNVDLRPVGRGTQRIEETLTAAFPSARIVRIDRDTARRRDALSHALERVRAGEGDILVGTQLLAKGHDFPNLTLVGVLNADASLLATDYRSGERLFATLMQVAGRAGRRERPGEVLVQTRFPQHPLYGALARHDFAAFASAQLDERRAAGFPPFVFEAALRAEARVLEDAVAFLREARALVEPPAAVTLYDPVPAAITRRAGYERAQLVAQSASRAALQAFLRAWSEALFAQASRAVRWHLDVDPIGSE